IVLVLGRAGGKSQQAPAPSPPLPEQTDQSAPAAASAICDCGNAPSPLPALTDKPASSEVEIRQWKTYADNGIIFRYPDSFVLRKTNGRILLFHFIKFKHLDPCDFSGLDIPPLKNLVDFKVSLKIVTGDGHSEIPETEYKIKFGQLNGKLSCNCFEGCGAYQYKFPIGENKTLIIERSIISIFNAGAMRYGDEDRARKRPGIITPDMEKSIFISILMTLKFGPRR
ncbi:MAG: hypothetical protein J2P21_06480, partial [Chloracidobacterium sp.]|nr:hypothetical protein [Chloracidobacterium sp.]